MLLGLPAPFRRGTGNTVTEAEINPQSYYAQDDWRVNDKLTVNFGLRYEAIPAPREDTDRLGNLVISRDRRPAYTRALCLWATTESGGRSGHRVGGRTGPTGVTGRH